jgi:hypothetical protein
MPAALLKEVSPNELWAYVASLLPGLVVDVRDKKELTRVGGWRYGWRMMGGRE